MYFQLNTEWLCLCFYLFCYAYNILYKFTYAVGTTNNTQKITKFYQSFMNKIIFFYILIE